MVIRKNIKPRLVDVMLNGSAGTAGLSDPLDAATTSALPNTSLWGVRNPAEH